MRRRWAALGFTLVELMVVVAIGGVLIALVGPSFRRMIETQRVQSINSQLVTDLQFARTEAVSKNARVRITFRSNATQSCYTMYTYTSNAFQCNCLNTPACNTAFGMTEIRTVSVRKDTGVTLVPGPGMPIEFAYEPVTGALYKIPTDFFSPPLTQYLTRTYIDTERTLHTVVSLTGRPTVCAPTGSKMRTAAC
jgi:type IV fimbrial biogenesis protein FimT